MNGLSLYERVMGAKFAQLAPALQRFHRLAGSHVLEGVVETLAPQSLVARVIAFGLGSPQQASRGTIRFELQAQGDVEIWTRCFPGQTMTSRLQFVAGELVESLGVARLTFALTVSNGALRMQLTRLRFLALPCPRWLVPQVVAEECGDGEQFYFHVSASLPWAGLVAGYRGHLVLPQEDHA
ncbi:MAG: DUF4166 domain-containing protein [Rubrivivax sp.]|nr:MAG: DUF4166 domain-containing protein [Rubrivivax sp.]